MPAAVDDLPLRWFVDVESTYSGKARPVANDNDGGEREHLYAAGYSGRAGAVPGLRREKQGVSQSITQVASSNRAFESFGA